MRTNVRGISRTNAKRQTKGKKQTIRIFDAKSRSNKRICIFSVSVCCSLLNLNEWMILILLFSWFPILEIPPYNGFGGEEDSLGNCFKLIPEPPKGDFVKFMLKDRCALDSNILRFSAKLVSKKPTDQDRLFIIRYNSARETSLNLSSLTDLHCPGYACKFVIKQPKFPDYSYLMSEGHRNIDKNFQ